MEGKLSQVKFWSIGFLCILMMGAATGASVAPVPSNINFGQVERGEVIEKSIDVRTLDIGQRFKIDPQAYSASRGTLFSDSFSGRFDVSQQPFGDWITVEETVIDPSTERVIELSNGDTARVDGNFTFRMEIPDDAEPGIRRGTVSLNPEITGSGVEGTAGASLIASTQLNFRFEVPGEVQRQITAQDVRAFRQGEDSAVVEVLLRNTGSVTTSTKDFTVDVFDQRGNEVGSVHVTNEVLEPRQSEWVQGSWSKDSGIEEGTYQIDGNVNYMTGSATASGSFSLPGFDVVEVVPSDDEEGGETQRSDDLPVWLVVMVLALLTVLMWGFDIEPFWILAVVGFLAISAFILMSGLPNLLLVVLLMVVGIVIYGGM
jgi:hypothetical protein